METRGAPLTRLDRTAVASRKDTSPGHKKIQVGEAMNLNVEKAKERAKLVVDADPACMTEDEIQDNQTILALADLARRLARRFAHEHYTLFPKCSPKKPCLVCADLPEAYDVGLLEGK